MTTVLKKGTISLTPRDLLRYAVDCDPLMKDIGSFIIKDIVAPSDNGYLLVFYPFEKKNIVQMIVFSTYNTVKI